MATKVIKGSKNWASRNHISGEDRSALESLVSDFARIADVTLEEAVQHVTDGTGITNQDKMLAFNDAIMDTYGDLDTFQATCASVAAPSM
jgi:hypothetical protein